VGIKIIEKTALEISGRLPLPVFVWTEGRRRRRRRRRKQSEKSPLGAWRNNNHKWRSQ